MYTWCWLQTLCRATVVERQKAKEASDIFWQPQPEFTRSSEMFWSPHASHWSLKPVQSFLKKINKSSVHMNLQRLILAVIITLCHYVAREKAWQLRCKMSVCVRERERSWSWGLSLQSVIQPTTGPLSPPLCQCVYCIWYYVLWPSTLSHSQSLFVMWWNWRTHLNDQL